MSPLLWILRLAATATVWLLALGTPLAWWLARTRAHRKAPVAAAVALPLVLAPVLLGLYLLWLLSPRGLLGGTAAGGGPLVLSFAALAMGSVLYAVPFVVPQLRATFAAVGREPLEAAATLGAGPLDRLLTVALPLAHRGLLAAAMLGFAHTVAAFGVVLMLGGDVAGRTRTLSIEVGDCVVWLDSASAHRLSLTLLALAFAVLLLVYGGPRLWRPRRP